MTRKALYIIVEPCSVCCDSGMEHDGCGGRVGCADSGAINGDSGPRDTNPILNMERRPTTELGVAELDERISGQVLISCPENDTKRSSHKKLLPSLASIPSLWQPALFSSLPSSSLLSSSLSSTNDHFPVQCAIEFKSSAVNDRSNSSLESLSWSKSSSTLFSSLSSSTSSLSSSSSSSPSSSTSSISTTSPSSALEPTVTHPQFQRQIPSMPLPSSPPSPSPSPSLSNKSQPPTTTTTTTTTPTATPAAAAASAIFYSRQGRKQSQPPQPQRQPPTDTKRPRIIRSPSYLASTATLVLFLCCVQYSYAETITLSPLEGKAHSIAGVESVLIILPEKGVSHTDYKIFGRLIQQLYPLRLWIELVEVAKGRELTLDNLPLIVTESNRRLKDLINTKKSPDVFLAAHGHYGHLAADYARAVPSSLRGLILFSAFLPKRMSVTSFPLPVLTVAGDVDGITRITRIAEALRRMMSDVNFDPSLATKSPLVILEGGNHETYITGHLPATMYQMDIRVERDKPEVMESAANVTMQFIVRTLLEPFEAVQEADTFFKASFDRAISLTKPIRDIRDMTQDTDFKSYWVRAAQKWMSGLEGAESSYLEVDSYVVDKTSNLALPPALVIEEGIPYIVTFSDVVTSSNSPDMHHDIVNSDVMGVSMMEDEDAGISPQAPLEIAARMLGPERIQKFLKNTSISKNYTCRDLNYCSFMTAYHTASEVARKRFDTYGRGVLFEPDVITDSEALWESTKLKIEVRDGTIYVTGIAYQTPQDESLTQYSGLYFCKLLPPDRALEWIYVDSLRRNLATDL